jgi:uroporphyrinogen-III synthase
VSLPVIVTRAEPAARDTAAGLVAGGYEAILSPALRLETLPDVAVDMAGVRHLVFTSANGVLCFPAPEDGDSLRVWCVGEATGAAARAKGWQDVQEGAGNAGDLAEMILADPDTRTGAVLHVANDAAAGDLVGRLVAGGRDARFAALYRMVPATAVSDAAARALTRAPRVAVLIHSAMGAEAFRNAARGLDMSRALIVAISAAAARPLAGCGARAQALAAHPGETALLAALDTAVQAL